jgi:hypothetical protein
MKIPCKMLGAMRATVAGPNIPLTFYFKVQISIDIIF